MYSTIDVASDTGPRAAPEAMGAAQHTARRSPRASFETVDLERAVPDIRSRLEARHHELRRAEVDACLSGAIAASRAFRLQEFRVILVERHAERNLRALWQVRCGKGLQQPVEVNLVDGRRSGSRCPSSRVNG